MIKKKHTDAHSLDLSIIIVNYNTRELLRDCLQSIERETADLRYEVIIVDNASSDGSQQMLEREFSKFKTVLNITNKGFAAANNQGIRIAQGRTILLLNSDTVVLDKAINRTIDFLERHPDVSIVGCKLLNADRSLQPSCMSFPTVWNIFSEAVFLYRVFPRTKLFGRYHMTWFDFDTAIEVDIVKGAFMAIRRQVLETLQGFDEAFFMYTEETDLCYRAKQLGCRVMFFPDASIIHFGGGSTVSTVILFKQFHLTQIQFIRKHFHGVHRWLAVGIKVVEISLRVGVYGFAGVVTLQREWFVKAHACLLVLQDCIFKQGKS